MPGPSPNEYRALSTNWPGARTRELVRAPSNVVRGLRRQYFSRMRLMPTTGSVSFPRAAHSCALPTGAGSPRRGMNALPSTWSEAPSFPSSVSTNVTCTTVSTLALCPKFAGSSNMISSPPPDHAAV